MNSFMGGGLFCAGMENILLIVSTATDYWMQYRQSSNYMHQSLWRYCTPGNCFPHGESSFRRIISLLICVIGIISGVTAFIHYSSFDRFDKRFDMCFLVFLPMSMFTGVTINLLWETSWKLEFLLVVYSRMGVGGADFNFRYNLYIHAECPRSATSH
ncbi:dapper [Sarotherodon galilaeus]